MRKIAEIRRDLEAKVAEANAFDPAKDKEALENCVRELNGLMAELHSAEQIEKAAQEVAERKLEDLQKKEGRKFSFVKFIREAKERQLTGLEEEVAKMGAEEYQRLGLTQKGFVIPDCAMRTISGNGKADIPADQQPATYVEGLRDRLVITRLGAHVLGGLVGTVPVVSSKAMEAGWGAEGAKATTKKVAFSQVSLSPHRNFVAGAFSGDLLRQTSLDVEAMIQNALLTAHAALIDKAAIQGTGSSDQPTGILATDGISEIAMGTNGAAIDWSHIVDLESKVNDANANRGKLGYLTNAKVIGALKTTEKATGSGRFIMEGSGNVVNGYPIEWTGLVPSDLTKGSADGKCSAVIFGNFEDLYVGHWGGIDLVVDPFTGAKTGEVNYVLNSWDDVKVVEPKSFAVIKDVLA